MRRGNWLTGAGTERGRGGAAGGVQGAAARRGTEAPRTRPGRWPEAAKETATELADKAKETTSKAGDQLAAGAEKVGDKAGPLLDRMGDRLKEAGQKLDRDTQDERDTAARETREALDDLKDWFKKDAKPAAEKNTEKLKGEIRDLADDIETKLDRAGKQTGKAADKTRTEIRDDLDKLRAKLREARDKGWISSAGRLFADPHPYLSRFAGEGEQIRFAATSIRSPSAVSRPSRAVRPRPRSGRGKG